ncbi:hypothetical protein KJ940_02375 [Myxococcota bacterium]|nr:hypothetical protein [Myxococcota bacterium]
MRDHTRSEIVEIFVNLFFKYKDFDNKLDQIEKEDLIVNSITNQDRIFLKKFVHLLINEVEFETFNILMKTASDFEEQGNIEIFEKFLFFINVIMPRRLGHESKGSLAIETFYRFYKENGKLRR